MTRKQFFEALLLVVLAAAAVIAAAHAQGSGSRAAVLAQNTPAQAVPASVVHAYDAANEMIIQGTVEKVGDAQAPENISGAHLFVTTEQGTIDAHLGPSASWKAHSLTLAPGDAVELTGVMTNFNGKGVLLARTLKMGNRIVVLRNEHGIPAQGSGARAPLAPSAATGGRP